MARGRHSLRMPHVPILLRTVYDVLSLSMRSTKDAKICRNGSRIEGSVVIGTGQIVERLLHCPAEEGILQEVFAKL